MLRATRGDRGTKARAAFTLLELLIVVGILAILAGILVMKLPDVINKANNAAWMSNLVELDKAIASYNATNNGQYPDGWDSLVDATGAFYGGMPGGTTGTLATTTTEIRQINATHLALLNRAGITTVQAMRSDPTGGFGATYFAYGNGLYKNPVTLKTDSQLVFLKKNALGTYLFPPQKLMLDDTHDYILVGVGQACSLMGANGWSKDCPVLRHSDGCLDPATAYSRACAVFDVGLTTGQNNRMSAKFVGTVAVGTVGLKFSDEMINIPNRLD